MFLLDTDTVSNLLDHRRRSPSLEQRILAEPRDNLWVSVITVEESARGWLAMIHRARNTPAISQYYQLLESQLRDLLRFPIAQYDDAARQVFLAMPSAVRQRQPQDCRIAAIALSRGFTVVTRNTAHFARIPGVRAEDWTTQPPA